MANSSSKLSDCILSNTEATRQTAVLGTSPGPPKPRGALLEAPAAAEAGLWQGMLTVLRHLFLAAATKAMYSSPTINRNLNLFKKNYSTQFEAGCVLLPCFANSISLHLNHAYLLLHSVNTV